MSNVSVSRFIKLAFPVTVEPLKTSSEKQIVGDLLLC